MKLNGSWKSFLRLVNLGQQTEFLVLEVIYSVQMRYLGWLPDQIIGPDFQSLVKLWYWNEIAAKVLESFSCLNTGWSYLNWTILENCQIPNFWKLW